MLIKSENRDVAIDSPEVEKIPIEKIVTEDVKKVAKEVAKRKIQAVRDAIAANITINVGAALKLHHAPEDLNWFMHQCHLEAQKTYKKELKKAKKNHGVFTRSPSGLILPD